MSSGKPVVEIHQWSPPSTTPMYPAEKVGGSTPAESYDVWQCNDAVDAIVDLLCRLSEDYAGGGLTLKFAWSSLATTGNGRWSAAIRRIGDDIEDTDTAHSYDFNTVDVAVASAAGELAYDQITFTNGADMDSWAAGEWAIIRFKREGGHANDTLSNTAYLWGVAGLES